VQHQIAVMRSTEQRNRPMFVSENDRLALISPKKEDGVSWHD